MIFNDRKQYVFKLILMLVAVITSGRIVMSNYEWQQNEDKIPAVSPGKYVVFCNEMSNTMKISKIDATEQYICYLYPGLDVVAIYDWAGVYQFSLAFFRANNGVMQIRCEDDLLYISDRETYEYVFHGDKLLCKYEPTDTTNTHPMGWFNQKTEPSFVVEKNMLYSASGNVIMELPGLLY